MSEEQNITNDSLNEDSKKDIDEEPKELLEYREQLEKIKGKKNKNDKGKNSKKKKKKSQNKEEKEQDSIDSLDSLPKITKRKRPKSTFRELKMEWDALHAEEHYVQRFFIREILSFWDIVEVTMFLFTVLLMAIAVAGILLIIIPIILSILAADWGEGQRFIDSVLSFFSQNIRFILAIGGGLAWVIRQMRKSEVDKFARKVNGHKKVTYVFGTSPYAEQVILHTTRRLGYEERIAIIADRDLLWVQGAKGKCPGYIVQDLEEFSKVNLYDKLKFKNAERIFILTESIELNQDILTFIRQYTDVEVILLSQYAPEFLKQIPLEKQNIVILEDLEANIEDLVFSLSLDIDMPDFFATETPAPRCYIGLPAEMMNSNPNLKKLEVIGIRRNDEILDTWNVLKQGDFVIIVSDHNTNLKRVIRTGRELSPGFENSEIVTLIFFMIIIITLLYFLGVFGFIYDIANGFI